MTILSAIAAFKGAFLGALLGSNLPHKGFEPANPQRPGYGKPGHHHCLHPTQPGYDHGHPSKPGHGKPYPDAGHTYPSRPSYPLFSFNR